MQQTFKGPDMSQDETEIRLSRHARQRMQQRAIGLEAMAVALRFGRATWSYGDRVYVLTDRSLLGTPYESQADRLRGLCVVVTLSGVVKSVMWNFDVARKPGMLRRSRGH